MKIEYELNIIDEIDSAIDDGLRDGLPQVKSITLTKDELLSFWQLEYLNIMKFPNINYYGDFIELVCSNGYRYRNILIYRKL